MYVTPGGVMAAPSSMERKTRSILQAFFLWADACIIPLFF